MRSPKATPLIAKWVGNIPKKILDHHLSVNSDLALSEL